MSPKTQIFCWKGKSIYFVEDMLVDRNVDYKKQTFVFNDFYSFIKANIFRVISIKDGVVKCRVLEKRRNNYANRIHSKVNGERSNIQRICFDMCP